MAILETKNLKKIYGTGENAVHALRQVNLTVKKGEFTAIVGTSGSGKSTLLHMLGGLDRPTSGEVIVDGKSIFSLKDEALTIFRRRKQPDCCFCHYPDNHAVYGIIYHLRLHDIHLSAKHVPSGRRTQPWRF